MYRGKMEDAGRGIPIKLKARGGDEMSAFRKPNHGCEDIHFKCKVAYL